MPSPLDKDPLHCPLCAPVAEQVVWSNDAWRVVAVTDQEFPAYYRVIARAHVREFSHLPPPQRLQCMQIVSMVERDVIAHLHPTKVNLASLGNVVDHLHWHVIARFDWDTRYPAPIWGEPQRAPSPAALATVEAKMAALDARIRRSLAEPEALEE